MSFTIVWTTPAVTMIRRLRHEDPDGAATLSRAVSSLAEAQHPTGSNPLGTSCLRRLRLGVYRVLYEVDTANSAVVIHSVGRTGRADAE